MHHCTVRGPVAASLALVLGLAVAGAGDVAAVAPPIAGIVYYHSVQRADQGIYADWRQEPLHVRGPLELGGALFDVDISTTKGYTCSSDVPGAAPQCDPVLLPVSGTARKHPSATTPTPRGMALTGTCLLPFDLGTPARVPCTLRLGTATWNAHVTLEVQQHAVTVDDALGYTGGCEQFEVSPDCVLEDLIGGQVSTDTPYDGTYVQR